MERVILGATGLSVSPIALGTMTFGDQVDPDASSVLLDLAVDRGINFLDTANSYNAGRTEQIIGRWLKARGGRHDLVIASKVRYRVGDDPESDGLSPKVVVQQLENSLKRLETDYLDICFVHQPDDDTPIETTWRCLDALVATGRVHCLGLSNFAAWQIVEIIHLARARGWTPPTVTQFLYNTISRGVENELLPMTDAYGLGTCAYNPLAGGLLTGKHRAGQEAVPESRLAVNTSYRDRYWNDRQRAAAERVVDIAREGGRTPVELALRFLLDHSAVNVALIGATSSTQLDENVSALDKSALTPDEARGLSKAWAELHGPAPRYNRDNRSGPGRR